MTGDGGFHVATWSTVSRQELYVATRFPCRQGGLGHDKDFSVMTESCWPRVAIGKATSR